MEPIDHLFRRESGRMIATVARIFGLHNLPLAEDVVQDAFCRAVEVWKLRGMPENPEAWLMATAKHRALDALRRERTARKFAPELTSEWSAASTMAEQFTPHAIRDDQLRMMVSCCDPRLAEEAQVSLVLHLVCGFSVDEIAGAFLSGHDAVEKRISRSKKRLAEWGRLFDLGAGDFPTRLWAVQRAIYLLFNEGYHGASTQNPVRSELCHEAMRLTEILLDHPFGRTPASYALLSLLCFNAARLPGRMNAAGDLTPLAEQDRSLWDRSLICRGVAMLERSAAGSELTEYHVEAMIASVHAAAASIESTDWSAILEYYDSLRRLRPSPVVELNRAIVIAQIDGAERALSEICRIADRDRLDRYPFYWATLGELESRLGRHAAARDHFVAAGALARNPAERRFLNGRALTEGQV